MNSRKDFQERQHFHLGSGGMLFQGAAARANVGIWGTLALDSWRFYQNVPPNKLANLNAFAISIVEEGRKRVFHGFGQSKVSIAGYVQEDNLAVDLAK